MLAIDAQRAFDGERLLADGAVVLVEGRRIVDVRGRGAPLPDGCEVAEFPGTTLLPGLIDAHVHLCGDSATDALERLPTFSDAHVREVIENALATQLASGVTTVRDLGDLHWAVLEWRAAHPDGAGLPTVIGSGPPITSIDGHCASMGGAVRGIAALRRAVRERAEHRADVVKIMASGGFTTPGTDAARPQFTVAEMMAVVDEAHSVGLPVTAHAHAVKAIGDALTAGVDAVEHCTFVGENGIEIDDAVVATLVASAIPVCPTLGIAPGVVPPPGVFERLRKAGVTYDARAQLIGRLHRAGVRLVSGSDGGINPGKRHGVLPEALVHLVDSGVSPSDALASATSVAADAYGLRGKGRLRAGNDADLLLVDGNALADISALRNVRAVYVRGQRRIG